MDELFTKYGWMVIAGIVIVLVLQFVPGFTTTVTTNISEFVSAFCTYIDTAIAALEAPVIG